MRASPAALLDHPSGYLALAPENRRFEAPGLDGFVSYRERGRHLVLLGGVHAAPPDRAPLLDRFLDMARGRRTRTIAVQVRTDQAEIFARRGFSVDAFGATYALELERFALAGSRRMKLRQKIQRARGLGLVVHELGRELPRDGAAFARLESISAAWLAAKGKKELEFLVGRLGRPEETDRRIFVALDPAGSWCGFITYVPVWGGRPGYLHDLTRRLPSAPPGTMEPLNAVAIERFRVEGHAYLHLGFTPFVEIDSAPAVPGSNRVVRGVLRLLWRYGHGIYPAREQARYKTKWAPEVVEPEWIAFRPLSLQAVLDLLLLTRSV